MKSFFICMSVALLATVTVKAQQIAVVTDNTTKMCQTLKDAIEASSDGSVIYLPGGGFQISDEVKITKRLTIIGIGHNSNGENADGNTTIAGNLWFAKGSDNSAVIGCNISGNISIGDEGEVVKNLLIRFCNINSVQVKNSECTGTIVNQSYVRGDSDFGNSEVKLLNNVIGRILNIATGEITNNVCCFGSWGAARYGQYNPSLVNVNNSTIKGNVFRGESLYFSVGSFCTVRENYFVGSSVGDAPVVIDGGEGDVFVNYNGWSVSPVSNFHFKNDYKQYESQVGIYAGTGFDDNAQPPVPYIIEKKVDTQTDASGILNIKIRVKAGL